MPRAVTRRSVARLAYAAPAVALTLAMTDRAGSAISGECPDGSCLVAVVVTDAATGGSIAGAFLDLPCVETHTDAGGRFVGCVCVGGFQVEAAGYVGQSGNDRDFCAQAAWAFALEPL